MQFQKALLDLHNKVEAEARLRPVNVTSSNILVTTTSEGFRVSLVDLRLMAALQEPHSPRHPAHGVVSTASLPGEPLLS